MPVKLKEQEDEPKEGQEKPVPFRQLKTRRKVAIPVTPLQQQVADIIKGAQPKRKPSKVVPFPKQPQVVAVVEQTSSVLEPANDDKLPRKARRSDRGGSGGGMQDQCPELKAWLGDFNEIPNNVCWLVDREKHQRATENSRRVRLMRFGDADHRPSRPEWKPTQRVRGWWGSRPPSVLDLVSNSRKIAEKLGPFEPDLETLSFLRNNVGKTVRAWPWQDPNCLMRDYGLDEVCSRPRDKKFDRVVSKRNAQFRVGFEYGWNGFLSVWPHTPFSAEDRVMEITDADVAGLASERNHPAPVKAFVGPPKPPISTMTAKPLTSSCTDLCPLICVGEGRYIASKAVTVYQRSFKDEQARNKRVHAPWAISYKDIKRPFYRADSYLLYDEYRYQLQQTVRQNNIYVSQEYAKHVFLHEELRKYYTSGEESPTKVTRADVPNFEERLQRVRYNRWMRKAERDDACRLDLWLATHVSHADPPMPHKRVNSAGEMRWNRYVQMFRAFERGDMTEQQLNEAALKLWKPTGAVQGKKSPPVSKEMVEWRLLMEDAVAPPEDIEGEWIMHPEDINRLPSFIDADGHLIIEGEYERQAVSVIASNSLDRVVNEKSVQDEPRYLALKRGFRGIKSGLFSKFNKSSQDREVG